MDDQVIGREAEDEAAALGSQLVALARALDQRLEESRRLLQIAEQVEGGLFLEDVLTRIYESFRPVIPYDRIGCALLSDGNRTLTARWARSESQHIKLARGYSAPMAGSSLEDVLRSGRPRIINDLEAYLDTHPESDPTRRIIAEGIRSSLTCPLVVRGVPTGFLFFSSNDKNTYRELHQGVFMRIAGQLSQLIEKSRLYQQLYDLNEQLAAAQRALVEQATHDALTGLFNRGAILELLGKEIERARRSGEAVGVVLADIDRFKRVNDEFGHQTGDAVLREAATRLQRAARAYDHVGRYGGEEFLVVLPSVQPAAAHAVVERLRMSLVDQPVDAGGHALSVTMSAGFAVAVEASQLDADRLIEAADRALYAAKRHGRNRVESGSVAPPPTSSAASSPGQ
jgi:diguanylate cyclase (GGDEF)-like protein